MRRDAALSSFGELYRHVEKKILTHRAPLFCVTVEGTLAFDFAFNDYI